MENVGFGSSVQRCGHIPSRKQKRLSHGIPGMFMMFCAYTCIHPPLDQPCIWYVVSRHLMFQITLKDHVANSMYVCMYVYIYIYMYMHTRLFCMYIYIYIYVHL